MLKFWKKIPVTPEEKIIRNKQRLFGILSGLMLGFAFPPFPFPFTLLIFIGLVPYFFVLVKKEKLIDINRFTYLTAFVFNVLTIYWVGGWGKETDPFLMIGGTLLLFINPIFFLIPSTLFYLTKRFINKTAALFLFPFFWIAYEYSYMITDASFPWVTLGNGLAYFNKFIQISDVVGVLGLSLIVIFINLSVFKAFQLFQEKNKAAYYFLGVAILFFFLPLVYGAIKVSSYKGPDRKIKVGLIQPNIDPWDKWSGGDLWNIAKGYLGQSQRAVSEGAELIVWPETALPVYLRNGSHQDVIDSIYAFIKKNDVYLLTGMPDFTYYRSKEIAPKDAKYSENFNYYYTTYNSVLLFSPYSFNVQRYGKMKLVPFGERVPFVDVLPFLGDFIKWNVGISGWNVGRDTLVFNLVSNHTSEYTKEDTIKVNSLVCFESVFPAFVAGFAQKGAELITVVTNDSWYGNSSGPYQHEAIGLLRAVENRRTVLRAANGGISTIIDPLGRPMIETKMFTKDVVVGEAPLEDSLTFYSKHPLVIPYLSYFISLVVILISVIKKFRYRIIN